LAILGAATASHYPLIVVPAGSDAARFRLASALRRLDSSRELITALAEGKMPPLIIHVVEGRLTT
jgi:hypothetical protein